MEPCTSASSSFCGLGPLSEAATAGDNGSSSSSNNLSCGACAWGWRRSESSGLCVVCSAPLSRSHWLYLTAAFLAPLLAHAVAAEWRPRGRLRRPRTASLLLHLSALLEAVVAAAAALATVAGAGLSLRTCGSVGLRDWYTALLNPPGHRCTSEAVYPLYSLPLIYHGFGVVALLLIRPALLHRLNWSRTGIDRVVYAALYSYPLLSVAWALLGGILYLSWPFLLLLGALVSNALILSRLPAAPPLALVRLIFRDRRRSLILLAHCGLFAFGLAGVTGLRRPLYEAPLLLLCPLPTAFFVLTAKLTHPKARQHPTS